MSVLKLINIYSCETTGNRYTFMIKCQGAIVWHFFGYWEKILKTGEIVEWFDFCDIISQSLSEIFGNWLGLSPTRDVRNCCSMINSTTSCQLP